MSVTIAKMIVLDYCRTFRVMQQTPCHKC